MISTDIKQALTKLNIKKYKEYSKIKTITFIFFLLLIFFIKKVSLMIAHK